MPIAINSMPPKELHCRLICRYNIHVIVVTVLCTGAAIFLSNVYQLEALQSETVTGPPECICKEGKLAVVGKAPPVVWVHADDLQMDHLKHVTSVFSRIGYRHGNASDNWDVLWVHDYPYTDSQLNHQLTNLRWHQKVNHFPGIGWITSKVVLATCGLSFTPKAFKMPEHKVQFLEYIKNHPKKKWMQKSNTHRGVQIKTAKELNLTNPNNFIQEYIDNPYLIDGRIFDLNIYATLTSVEPLRVYVYDTAWPLRFSPRKYHPFDPNDAKKYMVPVDYLPVTKVEPLAKYHNELKNSITVSLLTYMKQHGKDTEKLQRDLKSAVRQVFLKMEKMLIASAAPYASKWNFFDMVRFDFILDEHLNVYLLEVNLSPNLSSVHLTHNKLMYDQVIFRLLSLVGIARQGTDFYAQRSTDEMDMQVSDTDISVFAEQCASKLCDHNCTAQTCKLCLYCLNPSDITTIKLAYLEHTNRKTWRRVFPSPFPSQELARGWRPDNSTEYATLNDKNQLLTMWFLGKCLQDVSWCS